MSHQGSSQIPEWVAYLFSRRPFRPRDQIRVSYTAGGFLTAELPGKPKASEYNSNKKKARLAIVSHHLLHLADSKAKPKRKNMEKTATGTT